METSLVLQNVLTPPVLFFFLGLISVAVSSDLEIPAPLPKLFSLYLLLAIGFRGGFELQGGLNNQALFPSIVAAIAMSLAIPIICFIILRLKFDVFNSAAIAAAYGSISAVTFITAESFLKSQGIPFDGWMVAPLALMESPSIIVGLGLVKLCAPKNRPNTRIIKWRRILHESMLNGSVYLLLGSLIIGFLTAAHNPNGLEKIKPFTEGYLFYGVECFFLLDMGIVAAQRLPRLKQAGSFLILFAVLIPILNGCLGVFIAKQLLIGPGNALLFAVLCASASYLAVPTAMRMTVPEAKASYYISTTLGVTFPFNIVFGIPLYMSLVNNVLI